MALTYFTVVANYIAAVTDSADAGAEPDSQGISALVIFTPSVTEVHSAQEGKVVRLQPIQGRLEDDGVLKTLAGDIGVRLVANDSALGPLPELTYRADFSHVVYDQQKGQQLRSLVITAPATAVTIDLSDIEPVT